jgi:hypothetical protein
VTARKADKPGEDMKKVSNRPRGRKAENDVQTTLRLPTSLLQRIDAIAFQTEGPHDPRLAPVEGRGPPLNRSDAMRLALERGLDILAESLEKDRHE